MKKCDYIRKYYKGPAPKFHIPYKILPYLPLQRRKYLAPENAQTLYNVLISSTTPNNVFKSRKITTTLQIIESSSLTTFKPYRNYAGSLEHKICFKPRLQYGNTHKLDDQLELKNGTSPSIDAAQMGHMYQVLLRSFYMKIFQNNIQHYLKTSQV